MPAGNHQSAAQCPFFRFDNGQKHRIVCEGLVENSCVELVFQRKGDYKVQLQTYCCRHYARCEVYRMLAKRYEESD